ncbi:TRAP C4-dicarboxylate transporter permease [Actibacterium atlanticum]|uniref:TRAP transporter large permease protein n=1 Tax=Actibacterium atlanticum TaxID=1461693 RepID=A0A058ZKL0_9RHOB|nr:TRAP transporter large permease [Actibacterium atlanticum]KCV81341.1 TRAP C4-dicarboxylate transporter permease [Actibacterium atlanticum]
MSSVAIGLSGIFCALSLTLFGVPVAVSLGLIGLSGMWFVGGEVLMRSALETLAYNALNQYSFVVIPMFVLMGVLANKAKITQDLYEAFYRFMSKVRGSLFMVTILSSAGFATISGSTVVSAAVFTRLALPQMVRYGYHSGIGAGCVAAAGTFASLIPPSIMMVIYALLTGESIGRLFIAGVIPGALTAGVYLVSVWVMVRLRPQIAPLAPQEFTWSQKMESLGRVGPFLVLAILVVGGIYSGLMFPSSAGAVGAFGALGIAIWRGVGGFSHLKDALSETAVTATSVFMVLIGGLIFSRFLVFSGFITDIVAVITESGIAPYQVLVAVVLVYIALGMFIDTVSVTVITVPFIHPVMVGLGYDPIWFGVVLVKLIEISAITPPVGLNLFAVMASARTQISTGDLFKGVLPFLAMEFLVLLLIIMVPAISLWLPETML